MKTFAAQQLCFFPGIEFFQRMARADDFVLADDLQFTTHSNINRTRIKAANGPTWLTVPVHTKSRQGQRISETRIVNTVNWRQRHWKTLLVNYRNAPYFDYYADFLETLYGQTWDTVAELNLAGIRYIHTHLGLQTRLHLSSKLKISAAGDQRLIALGKALDCHCYLCPGAYRPVLKTAQFAAAGIALAFVSFTPRRYHQQFDDFAPGLSMLDLLLNEGPEAARFLLE